MGHGHHHHDDDHHHGGPTPERALWVAVVLNAAFLALESVVGLLTNSLALLSDAGHMISDVGALIIALVAVRVASMKPSSGYTFGLRRAPVLGGLVNGMSLMLIVVLITLEAVQRLGNPPDLDAPAVLWTGVAGLGVNLGSAWYLARSRDQSVNTRGAMLHLLADALGSVAAIVSALAVMFYGATLADPIASLVIAALILVGSWPLLRDTVLIMLQRAPGSLNVDAAKGVLTGHPEVQSVEDFHVWGLDEGDPVLSAIVVVRADTLASANAVADELRKTLRDDFHVEHATIECRHCEARIIQTGC